MKTNYDIGDSVMLFGEIRGISRREVPRESAVKTIYIIAIKCQYGDDLHPITEYIHMFEEDLATITESRTQIRTDFCPNCGARMDGVTQ